ncbi:hypothetical protein ABG768_021621 [Culter alburnus]|uniref:Uncharacterized protein n=1 Tax=Culter alburnus TaxID=194366 RepID=A0AAW2ARN2_CULAL
MGLRDLLEEPNSKPNDLKPENIPCQHSKVRNFSLMNNISTDKRAVLLVSNISNLMMINTNGPPTSKFDPRKYTRTWLNSHRAASPVLDKDKSVWNIL